MADLARTSTASASSFAPGSLAPSGSDMQRCKSTVIHRTRRGHSVIQKKLEIEKIISERDVEALAQSTSNQQACSSLSNTGTDQHSASVKNSKLFENLDSLDGTIVVVEEGTSSDDEDSGKKDKDSDPHNRSGKKTKPIGGPPPSDDHGNMEAEIEAEIQTCAAGNKSACNLSRGGLKAVPAGVAACVGISDLSLSDNSLSAIEGALMTPLQNLVILSLGNNRELTSLPIELFQLPKLESFTVDRCKLQGLPIDTPEGEAALALPNLVTFGAEWNHLKSFPFALLRKCPRLAEMFLAENSEVQQLPDPALIHQRAANGWGPVKVKVDNRPRLMQQVASLATDPTSAANFVVEWNKIYPDKVLDFLYLGSLRTAQCPEVYLDLDIGFILTAGRDLAVKIGEGMEQLELGLDDLPGEDMKPFFKDAFEFIERARAAKKGILIHCFAGMSRSVTFTAAYLMHIMYPMTRDQALELIRTSRPAAKPNEGFMRGLLQWEEMLKKERSAM